MKKLISLIAACLLVITCSICTSCSKSSSIEGTYYFLRLYYNGRVYNIGDKFGEETLQKDRIVVKVNKDNTLTYTYTYSGKKIEEKSIWFRYDEYTYIIGSGTSTIYAYYDNGTVSFKEDGAICVLQK